MKALTSSLLFALSVFAVAGCPEKKPDDVPAAAAPKPAGSSAAPKAPSTGGW